jgi:hypothetical protein
VQGDICKPRLERAGIRMMSLQPRVISPFAWPDHNPEFPWCQCQTGHPFISWYIQGFRRLEDEVMESKATGIVQNAPVALQAVEGGSLYRTHATLTLAQVMRGFAKTVHPTRIAACLLMEKDLEEEAAPAALRLVEYIFREVPLESFGRQFLDAGGHKLLVKYLFSVARNEAIKVAHAVEAARSALGNLMDRILEESRCDSLPDEKISTISELKCRLDYYHRVQGCKSDVGAPTNTPGESGEWQSTSLSSMSTT